MANISALCDVQQAKHICGSAGNGGQIVSHRVVLQDWTGDGAATAAAAMTSRASICAHGPAERLPARRPAHDDRALFDDAVDERRTTKALRTTFEIGGYCRMR